MGSFIGWISEEAIKPEGFVLLSADFFAVWYIVLLGGAIYQELKWVSEYKKKKGIVRAFLQKEKVNVERCGIFILSAALYATLNPWLGIHMQGMGFAWPFVLYGMFFFGITGFAIYNEHAVTLKELSFPWGKIALEKTVVVEMKELALQSRILCGLNQVLFTMEETVQEAIDKGLTMDEVLTEILEDFMAQAECVGSIQILREEDIPWCDEDFPEFEQDRFLVIPLDGGEDGYAAEVELDETVYIALVVDRVIMESEDFAPAILNICSALKWTFAGIQVEEI